MRFLNVLSLVTLSYLLSSCSHTNQPVVSTSPSATSPTVVSAPEGKLESLERRIAAKINLTRKASGLAPMTYHSGIANLARKHSEKMKKTYLKTGKRVLNHDGFKGRANKIILNYSMSETAENVAYIWGNTGDAVTRFNDNWMDSPGHRKNILKKWNYTGVGVAICPDGTIYATQLFGLKTDFTF